MNRVKSSSLLIKNDYNMGSVSDKSSEGMQLDSMTNNMDQLLIYFSLGSNLETMIILLIDLENGSFTERHICLFSMSTNNSFIWFIAILKVKVLDG